MKVLCLTRYGVSGASSRLRSIQYFRYLEENSIYVTHNVLIDDEMLTRKYVNGWFSIVGLVRSYFKRFFLLVRGGDFDVIWIEKEVFPFWPLFFDLIGLAGKPYILDYDDAVFHNYDMHKSMMIRLLYGRRLNGLMRRAELVVVGNEYLANKAISAGSRWIEILPTVIDLNKYTAPLTRHSIKDNEIPVVVWIGSPSTIRYLKLLHEPLRLLSRRKPFILRVVGGELLMPGVNVECIPWSESTEVSCLSSSDIGVMPLSDSPWERGKCGYKLIQYMACGLPVVGSPVGVNSYIIQDGLNGFLANDDDAWVDKLERLLSDPSLRDQMGYAGRQRVEREYCLQVSAPKLLDFLSRAARKGV